MNISIKKGRVTLTDQSGYVVMSADSTNPEMFDFCVWVHEEYNKPATSEAFRDQTLNSAVNYFKNHGQRQ